MRRLLPWVLVAAISSGGLEAVAAGLNWEFSGWFGGGCYPNVEFDANRKGRVFLTSDVAGAWRSDDDGDHWTFITKGLDSLDVAQVAVSQSSPTVLYAATKHGVRVSTDSGDSWFAADAAAGRLTFERPDSYRGLSIKPGDSSSVCAGTTAGDVFCSQTQGRDWVDLAMPRVAAKSPVTALVHTPDGAGLLAATRGGVQRYSFAAKTWTAADAQMQDVTDIVAAGNRFIAAGGGEAWSSDAEGLRWTRAEGQHAGRIYRLAYEPKSRRLYAAWNEDWAGGVLVSDTLGAAWTPLGQSMSGNLAANPTRKWAPSGTKITGLKINPFNPRVMIRTDWWGVWRSDDGGTTWAEKIVGTPNTVGTDLAFSRNGQLAAATMDNGLLRSTDLGRTYTPVFPVEGYRADVNGHVWRVAFFDNNHFIATSSPWNAAINQVLLGSDGGATVQQVRAGLPAARPKTNTMWGEGYPRGLAISPHDKRVVYLGIDGDDGGGLFISRDAGMTWARSAGQPASLRIYNGLAVDAQRPGVLYWGAVGPAGGIYRSTDDGNTWQIVFQDSRAIFDLHVARDAAIYATGGKDGASLFVSRDHGDTWSLVRRFSAAGDTKAIASNPLNPKMLAVSTVNWDGRAPQGIYLSSDAGANWLDITGNLPAGAGAAAMAFSPDGRYLYVSRYAGSIYRLQLPNVRG